MGNEIAKGRVIVLSARSIMSLVVAQSLGRRGIEIIGADCIPVTLLSMSKHVELNEEYTNYLDDEEAFLLDVERICKKYKPDDDRPYILIPVFKETMLIAKNADRLEKHITLACPSKEAIESIFPKDTFTRTAQKHDVNIPKTMLPESGEDIENVIEKLTFPMITKPYDESGGRGIHRAENEEELREAVKESWDQYNQMPLVQEAVEGSDYCFTAILQDGEIKASMAYKNLHQFPPKQGSGVMRETVDHKPFIEQAAKLFKPLKWNGVAEVDFMWDGDGRKNPTLIEVNPRFWAGLYHSVESGVDYPWLNYLLFSGQEIPEQQDVKIGVKTKLPAAWIPSLIRDAVHIDSYWDALKGAGKAAFEEFQQHNNLWKSVKSFVTSVQSSDEKLIDFDTLDDRLREARNAETELISSDDPKAATGMIYGLVYLAKYGKLPPEIGL